MAQAAWQAVDGRTRYAGRTLAKWVPDVVADLVAAAPRLRVLLFGSVTRLARAINAPAPVDLLVTDPTEIAERGDLPGILRVALREGRWCMTKRAERLRREVWRWRKPGTPDVRRTVTENARTLAFDTHQFGSE